MIYQILIFYAYVYDLRANLGSLLIALFYKKVVTDTLLTTSHNNKRKNDKTKFTSSRE